jgi:voltage-gated potassium channel
MFSVIVFSVEYILRIWSCTSDEQYSRPIVGRIKYAIQPLVLVDLLAILPFYLPFVTRLDLRFLRILRIFRVLRVLKLERYFVALSKVARVMKRKASEIISTFIVMFILIVLSASLMYYVEPQTYDSIPHAMWWGIVTLTTVGYGDVYPQTALGQLIGSILALLGIGLFGLPAGILAAGFIEEIQSKNKQSD